MLDDYEIIPLSGDEAFAEFKDWVQTALRLIKDERAEQFLAMVAGDFDRRNGLGAAARYTRWLAEKGTVIIAAAAEESAEEGLWPSQAQAQSRCQRGRGGGRK